MRSSLKATLAVLTTIFMTAISCNKEIAETQTPLLEKHTCEMKLVGSLVNFDGPETRAEANTATWTDGSIIYLRMNSPLGATTGEAIYNASKDVWTISYYGSLYEGASNSCSALYLEDKVSYENNLFTFDEGTAIYEDLEGTYIYDGGDLIVTANLSPKIGRIRFKGTPGSVLKVYGITHYTTYDISTDNYTTSATPFKLTVGEDGYTPYLYGYFTDTDEPNVKLWIDAKEAYTRYCSKNIFNAGQSGKMTVPTESSHDGWADGLYFNVNDVQFKMIAVEGGTFVMGDPNSTSEYYTAHNVTLTGFCIAETEMTEQLHSVSIGQTSTSLKPCRLMQDDWNRYIPYINDKTLTEFTLPTEAQWEYAARGGKKSKGFKYSGSDNIEDVAWYSGNSTSVNNVKTKMPNELGIYDMSGNAAEWTLDKYSKFTSAAVKDPLVTISGRDISLRGGSYKSDESYTVLKRSYADLASTGVLHAYRLVLNWN